MKLKIDDESDDDSVYDINDDSDYDINDDDSDYDINDDMDDDKDDITYVKHLKLSENGQIEPTGIDGDYGGYYNVLKGGKVRGAIGKDGKKCVLVFLTPK